MKKNKMGKAAKEIILENSALKPSPFKEINLNLKQLNADGTINNTLVASR